MATQSRETWFFRHGQDRRRRFRARRAAGLSIRFCHMLHDANEIVLNGSKLARLLGPGSVLLCHDSNDTNESLLRQYIHFRKIGRVDSILICVVTERRWIPRSFERVKAHLSSCRQRCEQRPPSCQPQFT